MTMTVSHVTVNVKNLNLVNCICYFVSISF